MDSALDACYQRHANLLQHIVQRFQRRYGGDAAELWSEANWYWLHAFRTWEPTRTHAFGQRMRFVVWHGLLDQRRMRTRHQRLLPTEGDHMLAECTAHDQGRWQRLLTELSDDAKTIVSLTIGPHLELLLGKQPGRMRALPKHGLPIRMRLKKLLENAGWSGQQVLDAFREIREALG